MNSKKIFIACIISGVLSVTATVLSVVGIVEARTHEHEPVKPITEEVKESTSTNPETTEVVKKVEPTTHKSIQPKPMNVVDDDEIELLAWVMVAEAEGTSEYCQRLVIDTILNRVDSDEFPDTITGVVYQNGQFDVMTNGRLYRCVVTDDARRLVREELHSRTNSDVLYFRDSYYHNFGTPVASDSNMYFSK